MRTAFALVSLLVLSSSFVTLGAAERADEGHVGHSGLSRPTTPDEALAALRTRPGLKIELVAAEPLVIDPIAVEFGTDGRLWVVEMRDYPMGMDGNWKPGGVIKVLDDVDSDGRYDKASVFMDEVPFPSGVMPWKKGALVCTAPDILYAEDTDGDGRADQVRKVLTGFITDNYQARVNSLTLGLDNWIYAANGLRGGLIRGASASSQPVDIRGRDFRLHPDTAEFEPVAGLTQFGRVRDDWGNWFGCDNTRPLLHFPLPDHYIQRNPHVAAPGASISLRAGEGQIRVFPLSQPLDRSNNPDSLNSVTSGCGLGLYRDTLLGEEFAGNAFVCEPVHSLVMRLQLSPRGATFEANRAADERDSEFLASTSHWFTPVQSRPGPDGGLWVVDMVRPIVEHPRFIPPERLARLDPRAGDDRGRIYRVSRDGVPLRPIRDLTSLALPELVAALGTPNGIARDLAHLELMFRSDRAAVPMLDELFRSSELPAVRIQALAAIEALGGNEVGRIQSALADRHPAVRRFALRLSEPFLAAPSALDQPLAAMANDADFGVRYQLALSVGGWHDTHAAARLLAQLVTAEMEDPWLRPAVMSSATKAPLEILQAVLASTGGNVDKGRLAADLITTAVALTDDLDAVLIAAAPRASDTVAGWQMIAIAGLQEALAAREIDLSRYSGSSRPELSAALSRIRKIYSSAPAVAASASSPPALREAAIRLLTSGFNDAGTHLPLVVSFLENSDSALMPVAVQVLRRNRSPKVPGLLLANWSRFSPSLRATVVDILVGRREWTADLIAAIERGEIPINAIPASTRQRLMRQADDGLRTRAEKLFAAGAAGNRQHVIARYQGVQSLTGDLQRGAQVFANVCSTCHAFVGKMSMGPTLVTFRHKSVDDFLTAILDPNAAIEPKFTGYSVTIKDGRSLAGVISSESATSFTLMLPGNQAQPILRNEVAAITALEQSFMPEGLEGALTPQAMADLIRYITAFKDTAGSAPAR